jgi:c-di-GMP-related signal transduction protein
MTVEAELQDIYLARQPILNRQQRLVAYELLFRSGDASVATSIDDNRRATATVIQNAFNGMGIEAVLGHAHGYINVTADFLFSDFVEMLPAKQVVLEILGTVEPTKELIARVNAFRRMGYTFALDDYDGDSVRAGPLLDTVDVVKVDLRAIDPSRLEQIAFDLRRRRLQALAEKVETSEDFERTSKLGFDLFQGYHFARPQILTAKQQKNTGKALLLRLLSLIMSDVDTAALEAEVKRHPALSYKLLRMVNSAAAGLREPVNSLNRAIVLLGRRQLQIWMQLLLYTAGDNDKVDDNPLLQMAATRGKLMETIAKVDPASTREDRDAAFMTGILSLIDVLLELPQEEVLSELLVSDDIKKALSSRTGPLGYLLRLAEQLEEDNHAEVKDLIEDVPGMSLESLLGMQLDAFFWANKIEG